jgi:hypothetical protein
MHHEASTTQLEVEHQMPLGIGADNRPIALESRQGGRLLRLGEAPLQDDVGCMPPAFRVQVVWA